MQSWQHIGPSNGQNDHQPNEPVWHHPHYVFDENSEAQLRESNPTWSQPMPGQVAYPDIDAQPPASHEPGFFSPGQAQAATLQGHAHHGFHGDHGQILGSQFSQAGAQGIMDGDFEGVPVDMFQDSFQDGLVGISQTPSLSHDQVPYASNMFSFVGRDGQSFDAGSSGAYSNPQLHQQIPVTSPPYSVSQPPYARPPIAQQPPQIQYRHAHGGLQQHDRLQQGSLQQQGAVQQQGVGLQQQGALQQQAGAVQQQVGALQQQAGALQQRGALQQGNYSSHFSQQQYPNPNQPLYVPAPTPQRQVHGEASAEANNHVHAVQATQATQATVQSPTPPLQGPPISQPTPPPRSQAANSAELSGPPATKKRKAVPKKNPLDVGTESAVTRPQSPATLPAVAMTAKADGNGAVSKSSTPVIATEPQVRTQIEKRRVPEKPRLLEVPGLPNLVLSEKIRFSAPKSYEKLAPAVAIPSRSGKPMVPGLGYDLPCEVQGRFTQNYKPHPGKSGGLDERRSEADALLKEFERDMKKLGKRRPKNTEYPHTFKEQLKTDEALKTRAERKAKKESKEDATEPAQPETRPTDAVEVAAWDMLEIVQFDPSTRRTHVTIARAVQQAGELVIKLRGAMARVKQDLDEAIKAKKSEGELSALRKELETKREVLFRALDTANEYGDDRVLENLGAHQKLVMALANVLIACIKANDFSSKLPKAALELMSNFSMTKKVADNATFEVVRKRFADKGDDEVKELLRIISSRIKNPTPSTEAQKKTDGTESSPGRPATVPAVKAAATAAAPDGSSAKRSRDDDTETRPVKKIAVESNSLLSKKLGASRATPTTKASVASLLGKNRPVARPAPKPEGAAADSGAKPDQKTDPKAASSAKPDTINPVAPKTDQNKPPQSSRTVSGLGAPSGIASLLDSINAPKPELKSGGRDTKSAISPDETPEQKAKRLRKEARRKLKVSWKEGDDLVQVRIFHKEAAEDEGRSRNLTRDAADDKSEGMVLKQRATLADEDEDEDELPYQPWESPSPLDVSKIPFQYRNKTYVTRGGTLAPESQEQKLVAEREQRELMVVYTDTAEIPPTPKSPPSEAAVPDAGVQGKIGRLPETFEETLRRWDDVQRLGQQAATYHATQRLDAMDTTGSDPPSKGLPASSVARLLGHKRPGAGPQRVIPAGTFEEQLMFLLQLDQLGDWKEDVPFAPPVVAQSSSDPATQVASQAAASVLGRVASILSGKPFPPTQPPEWLDSEEKIREWWMGYNRDQAAKARRNAEEQARLVSATAAPVTPHLQTLGIPAEWAVYYAQQQQQQQQQTYAPYMAMLQQMRTGQQATSAVGTTTVAAPTPPTDNSQLQNIFAQLNPSNGPPEQVQQQVQAQTGQSQSFMGLNPNDPTYSHLMMLRQLSQAAKSHPATQLQQGWSGEEANSAGEDWERDRDRSRRGRDRDRRGEGGETRGGGVGGASKKANFKVVNPALIGTKSCMFWKKGECTKGDECTFRHD